MSLMDNQHGNWDLQKKHTKRCFVERLDSDVCEEDGSADYWQEDFTRVLKTAG